MNCDEFLDAMASPDERRQTAARWHANSCPSCAALADIDARLKKELGEPEPLPQRMRAVWEAAADGSPRPTPARRASEGRNIDRKTIPLLIVATAASLLFLIVIPLLIWQLPDVVVKEPDTRKQPVPDIATVKTIDASAELDKLLAQVTALEVELNKTSKQADLVDVRREADLLLATYSHW